MTAPAVVSILDAIELDTGYTTVADQFYRRITPQELLDGARVGMVAYLRGCGIANPRIALMRARKDGRRVVPQIGQQLGRSIARYGTRVSARDLVYSTIRGELAALHDPYSVFFTATELRGFTTALDGRPFGGVGLVLAADPAGRFSVDQVFPDGPAARAGIQAGDRIASIDQTSADGLSPAAIAARLRGPIGTVVRLALVRNAGSSEPLDVALTRAAITPPDVSARLLPHAVGYVGLRTFGPTAGQQVHAALAGLHTQGAQAIVLDLRGNGGGYESAAVRVASAFITAGPIVATQTNRGHRRITEADGSALPPLPLVVLVDADSASGSELVAGAIQDHGVGRVVGVRTFGKGLVQTIFPLPDGSALKLTTARYYTPNGRDIDRIGIVPDVVVAEPAGAQRAVPGHDAQLDTALTLLTARAVESHHFGLRRINQAPRTVSENGRAPKCRRASFRALLS